MAYLQNEDVSTEAVVYVKTFIGDRRYLKYSFNVNNTIDLLKQTILKDLELGGAVNIKLVYPMGVMREVDGIFATANISSGAKLIAMVSTSLAWDDALRGKGLTLKSHSRTVTK
jgi:hypothetical protein